MKTETEWMPEFDRRKRSRDMVNLVLRETESFCRRYFSKSPIIRLRGRPSKKWDQLVLDQEDYK